MLRIGCSRLQLPVEDDLSGADTKSFSESRRWNVAKAVRLLNELAVTLTELEAGDPLHPYSQAANEDND